jgi:membrane protein DedA with SNARE-associated domain
MAVARYAIPVAAIPVAPALIPDDVGLLMLIRPGKEVILLAGGLSNTQQTPGIWMAFLAYLPLMLGAIWIFFAVGRAWGPALEDGSAPDVLTRVLPPERVRRLHRLLETRGPLLAVVGRIGGLPPTIIAAAAGTSKVGTARFLVADALGAVAGFGLVFGIGWLLGDAYERGGPWLTAGATLLVVVAGVLVNRWFRAELEGEEPGSPA